MGTLLVPPEAAGERLDRFLAVRLETPRSQVQQWIAAGRVAIGGQAVRASTRLAGGERLRWSEPPATSSELTPEVGELTVLYLDDHLIVVDKPAGLTVHPGAGRAGGTLAHRLLARFPELEGVGGRGRPGVVHRLDRGTTGALVVARTPLAYGALTAEFSARRVHKRYLAVVHGSPAREALTVEQPIGRHPVRRKEMTVRAGGRPARSVLRVLERAAAATLLEVELTTGRTHQIRVHLKSAGYPLVGDPVYGEARWKAAPRPLRAPLRDFPRPALHAWKLAFAHPATGEPLAFEAPPPADLDALWRALSGHGIAASSDASAGEY